MAESTIKVGVVGVGNMGRNHARSYREIPQADLVGVADSSSDRAREIAALYGCRPYSTHHEMLDREKPDAISITVPTAHHHAVTKDALAAGIHVLVEKPIASTLAQAREMTDMARDAGLVLMVGHIERFNPAVIALKERLMEKETGKVFQIHTRRLNTFPAHVRDVGVVVDLVSHDFDVMRHLVDSDVARLYAETRRLIHETHEDMFTGMITFTNGVLGLLEANWVTPTKIRELYVTTERGMYVVDYITQDLFLYENGDATAADWATIMSLRGVSEGTMTRFAISRREPLRVEHEAFLAAVQGDPARVVTGDDGAAALNLSLKAVHSATVGEVVYV